MKVLNRMNSSQFILLLFACQYTFATNLELINMDQKETNRLLY